MQKQYVDWSEFGELVKALSGQITDNQKGFVGIIGISRGGLPIAVTLSHRLDLPISHIIRAASYDENNEQGDLQVFTQAPDTLDTNATYLIVDDICDTGQTLDAIQKIFPKSSTCALFLKPEAKHIPDYWTKKGDKWVVFPWETNSIDT